MEASRSYDDALRLLSKLQSNKAIETLFVDVPKDKTGKDDLNAAAIPKCWPGSSAPSYAPLGPGAAAFACMWPAPKARGRSPPSSHPSWRPTIPCRRQSWHVHIAAPGFGRESVSHIDGRPVSQELFASISTKCGTELTRGGGGRRGEWFRDADGGVAGPATRPFYFRFPTIMAFHIFLREGVTSAVIECGIGGEYDATNVLPAKAVTAAVITQLGIDHVFMLGDYGGENRMAQGWQC